MAIYQRLPARDSSLASGKGRRSCSWCSKRALIAVFVIVVLPSLYLTFSREHITKFHPVSTAYGLVPSAFRPANATPKPTQPALKDPQEAANDTPQASDSTSQEHDSIPHASSDPSDTSYGAYQAPYDIPGPTDYPRPASDQPQRHLRLVIPATRQDVGLCKTLFSAAALGYPAPFIVNWGKHFRHRRQVRHDNTHVAKVWGILDYLESLPGGSDEDLVLVIDGLDVWIQLPVETLIRRYFDIIKRHNQRVRDKTGSEEYTHQVVFASQKRCWPNDADSPACSAVPESTLPANIYGNVTDTITTEAKEDKFEHFRPRYLNSGSVMGTVGALRKIFTRAKELVAASPGQTHDQAFFSEIFGQQELMRGRPPVGPASTANVSGSSRPELGQNHEFGIALDYELALVMPTVWCWHETEWVRFRDGKRLRNYFHRYGIPQSQYERTLLPGDIARTPPPSKIASSNFTDHDEAAKQLTNTSLPSSWRNASLFADLRTGTVPVAIHHNARKDHTKAQLIYMWNQTWFQPHLRTLLSARAGRSAAPIAVLDTRGDGVELEWWGDSDVVDGVLTQPNGQGEPLAYSELCSDYDEELFRDKRGSY